MTASSVAGKIAKDESQESSEARSTGCCRGSRNQTDQVDHTVDQYTAVALNIKGINCNSCAGQVKTALEALDGVADAAVDIAARRATVRYNQVIVDIEALKAAVTTAGYEIAESDPQDLKSVLQCCEQPAKLSNPWAYIIGVLASFAVIGAYLGMNTLTSDWYFARVQFSEYRWWIISLAIGLGIQVTLYALFRSHHRGKKKTAANSSMAASGGVSAVAMMACCSHYLATILNQSHLLSGRSIMYLKEFSIGG